MGAATQTGAEWKIGYGVTDYTGYQVEDATQSQESDEGLTVQYFRAVDVVRSADGQHFLSAITAECWCSPSDFDEEEEA